MAAQMLDERGDFAEWLWCECDALEDRGEVVDRYAFARELAQHFGEHGQGDHARHDLAHEHRRGDRGAFDECGDAIDAEQLGREWCERRGEPAAQRIEWFAVEREPRDRRLIERDGELVGVKGSIAGDGERRHVRQIGPCGG